MAGGHGAAKEKPEGREVAGSAGAQVVRGAGALGGRGPAQLVVAMGWGCGSCGQVGGDRAIVLDLLGLVFSVLLDGAWPEGRQADGT